MEVRKDYTTVRLWWEGRWDTEYLKLKQLFEEEYWIICNVFRDKNDFYLSGRGRRVVWPEVTGEMSILFFMLYKQFINQQLYQLYKQFINQPVGISGVEWKKLGFGIFKFSAATYQPFGLGKLSEFPNLLSQLQNGHSYISSSEKVLLFSYWSYAQRP